MIENNKKKIRNDRTNNQKMKDKISLNKQAVIKIKLKKIMPANNCWFINYLVSYGFL